MVVSQRDLRGRIAPFVSCDRLERFALVSEDAETLGAGSQGTVVLGELVSNKEKVSHAKDFFLLIGF